MTPIKFKRSNKKLQPSPGADEYSDNVTGIAPLPIWTDGEQCVSCWRPSIVERLSILFFGRVWVAVLSGGTQPPIYVDGFKEYLKDGK